MEFLEHGYQLQCREERNLVNISATVNHATSWTGSPPISQVETVLLSTLNCGFFLEHLWDPGIQLLPGDELWYAGNLVEHSVDKLEPPWSSILGLCITLPTGTAAFGCHSCAVWLAPVPLQLEQLTMVKFPAMTYLFAHAATMCCYFSSGNLILLRKHAKQSNMIQFLKESQATYAPDCVVSAVYPKFSSFGMVMIFSPGLYEGQATHMLLITEFCSGRMASWNSYILQC